MFGCDVCIDCEESTSIISHCKARSDQSNGIFACNNMSSAFLLLRFYLLSIWKCDQNKINNFVHFGQTTTTGKSLFIFKNCVIDLTSPSPSLIGLVEI